METIEVKDTLVADLKDMRKGEGWPPERKLDQGSLLSVLYDGDADRARAAVAAAALTWFGGPSLGGKRQDRYMSLLYAFAWKPTEFSPPPARGFGSKRYREKVDNEWDSIEFAEDLTTRRRDLADRQGVSERTVVRLEDEAIENIAGTLADHLMGGYNRTPQPPKSHAPMSVRGSVSEKIEQFLAGPTTEVDTSRLGDLPALLHEQVRLIQSLKSQLAEVEKANTKMMKLLGL